MFISKFFTNTDLPYHEIQNIYFLIKNVENTSDILRPTSSDNNIIILEVKIVIIGEIKNVEL